MRSLQVKENGNEDPSVGKLQDIEFNSIYDELKTLATQDGLVALNNSSVRQLFEAVVATTKRLTGLGLSNENAKLVPLNNLNNITESGVYRCLSTHTNAPVALDCSVLALVISSTQTVQIANAISAPETIYVRTSTSGVFTSWFTISSSQTFGMNSASSPNYGGSLNLYRPSGIYTVSSSITGAPTTLTGSCFVLRPTASAMVQMFITTSTTDSVQSETYIRYCTGGTGVDGSAPTNFEAWRKVMYLQDVTAYVNSLGLGVDSIASSIADCNAITISGNYRTRGSVTTNTPIFSNFYTLIHQAGGDVDTVATQIAIDTNNSGEMYIRQRTTASGWGAWRAISTRAYALGDSIRGNAPTWTSTTSITMPAGLECADSLRTTLIRVASSTVIDFTATGLNGLDAGSLASNTWYYIHAILNPSTGATGYVASTSSTSPTLPSGFTIRRLLPYMANTLPSSATLIRATQHLSGNVLTYRYADTDGPVLVDKTFGINNTLWHSFALPVPNIGSNVNISALCNLYARSDNSSFEAFTRPLGSGSTSGIPIYACESVSGATGIQTIRSQVAVPCSTSFPYSAELRHTNGAGTFNRSTLSFNGFIAEVST